MAYNLQYIPCSSCSERGVCKLCEKRIAKERDLQRRIERMHAHFRKANAAFLERDAQGE